MVLYTTLASTMFGATLEIAFMLMGAFGLGILFQFFLSHGMKKQLTTLDNQLRLITFRYETADSEFERSEKNLKRLKTQFDKHKWETEQLESHEEGWNQLQKLHKKDEKRLKNLEKERSVLQEQVDELKVQLLQANMQQATTVPTNGTSKEAGYKIDDFKMITGIGPKIETLLHDHDLYTYSQLARASIKKLNAILSEAGNRYAAKDPSQWPTAAKEVKGAKKD